MLPTELSQRGSRYPLAMNAVSTAAHVDVCSKSEPVAYEDELVGTSTRVTDEHAVTMKVGTPLHLTERLGIGECTSLAVADTFLHINVSSGGLHLEFPEEPITQTPALPRLLEGKTAHGNKINFTHLDLYRGPKCATKGASSANLSKASVRLRLTYVMQPPRGTGGVCPMPLAPARAL